MLKAHYVVIYSIAGAKTRRLALLLPDSTPLSLTIRGLEGATVEFTPETAGALRHAGPAAPPDERGVRPIREPPAAMRRWNVLLDQARRGEVRLAVDFEMRPPRGSPLPPGAAQKVRAICSPLPPGAARKVRAICSPLPPGEGQGVRAVCNHSTTKTNVAPTTPHPSPLPEGEGDQTTGKVIELKDFALPMLTADGVVYQSGMVAIEGDLELGVEVQKTDARRADVGQLAIARYALASVGPNQQQAGPRQSPMRLVGTYEFLGDPPRVPVERGPQFQLRPHAGDCPAGQARDLALGGRHEPDEGRLPNSHQGLVSGGRVAGQGGALVGRAGRHAPETADAERDSPDRPAAQPDRGGAESATRL